MPKFLVQFGYTGEGLKGLAKEGGSKRRERVIEQLVEIMGGKAGGLLLLPTASTTGSPLSTAGTW